MTARVRQTVSPVWSNEGSMEIETHPLQPMTDQPHSSPPPPPPPQQHDRRQAGDVIFERRKPDPSALTEWDKPSGESLPPSPNLDSWSAPRGPPPRVAKPPSPVRTPESDATPRESPDHQLPVLSDADSDIISQDDADDRNAYTPWMGAKAQETIEDPQYDDPSPDDEIENKSPADSETELISRRKTDPLSPIDHNTGTTSPDHQYPSEKMVPLPPIGSNRVEPLVERAPAPNYGGNQQDAQQNAGNQGAQQYGGNQSAQHYAGNQGAQYQGGNQGAQYHGGNQAAQNYARRNQQQAPAVLEGQGSERDLLHENFKSDKNTDGAGCCGWVLYMFSILLIVFTLPFSLMFTIKVVQEYERAVIFRLGRLPSGGAKGPGIFFIIPCIESYSKVDLRTVSFDVPPQEVLTKDSVTVSVDAVVYYRVSNPTVSVANVENAHHSTRLLAQTTLRNILGTKNMSEILSDREAISHGMQSTLDEATDRWGIKVERVEIKDVRLPVQLQRAMAAEAEASREARAKVIAAEGEQKASKALKEAADVMCQSSAALQLRYLQTLNSISAEKNSTIIFPLPIDLVIAAEGEHKASHALKEAADVMCQSSAALQLRYLQTLNSISAEKNSTIIFPLPIDLVNSFLNRGK